MINDPNAFKSFKFEFSPKPGKITVFHAPDSRETNRLGNGSSDESRGRAVLFSIGICDLRGVETTAIGNTLRRKLEQVTCWELWVHVMMLVLLLYPMRKRFRFMANWGPYQLLVSYSYDVGRSGSDLYFVSRELHPGFDQQFSRACSPCFWWREAV